MKSKGIGTTEIIMIVIALNVVAGVAYYFLFISPSSIEAEAVIQSKVRVTATPSSDVFVLDINVNVTNGESGTMTISKITIALYESDQLMGTITLLPENFITSTIPIGETKTIYQGTGVIYGSSKITCYTNYRQLNTSCIGWVT